LLAGIALMAGGVAWGTLPFEAHSLGHAFSCGGALISDDQTRGGGVPGLAVLLLPCSGQATARRHLAVALIGIGFTIGLIGGALFWALKSLQRGDSTQAEPSAALPGESSPISS
jgi:hypothetical protein